MNLANPACRLLAAASMALCAAPGWAQKGETVRIAWIDPLSGLMAPVGQNTLKSYQYVADHFNQKNAAGVKFEVIGIDNKLSPAETLTALKSAIDQNIRYVLQGSGTGPAVALIDAIAKHNERNPGKEVVYLNYAAMDPDLTNSKCSYWHFRLDADTSMKMEALTSFIKDQKNVQKVFLLNQNYAHGQQVARYAKQGLAAKRPDVQIVGEDLHPLASVRDFSPYVAKIKASGADTVITGNWGSDLTLLIKAAQDAGLKLNFYTYYAGVIGTAAALGADSEGRVFQVAYVHSNMTGPARELADGFKKKFDADWYVGATYHTFALLSEAMAKARSTDPVKVAAAMEGLRFKSYNGEVEMRAKDHQMQQTLYISSWQKATPKAPYSVENSGYNFASVRTFEPYVASTPSSCEMKRPS
jgi:branched-chain amino acid transport system substrate-binding protein